MIQPTFNPESIRFRASSIYNLCTSLQYGLTDKQKERLIYLFEKPNLTELQQKEYADLVEKMKAIDTLPQGAITHLYDIYDSAVYGIREDVAGKQIDKGLLCEQDSFALIQPYFGFLLKNTQRFESGLIVGTPDALTEQYVIDTKTSWNLRTFRQAELTPLYHWQLQAYMHLTGRNKAVLAYCLVDTPLELINDEIKRQTYYKGIIDDNSEQFAAIEAQVHCNMTFSDKIPAKNRVKFFHIDRDEKMIDSMKRRTEMALKKLIEIHQAELDYQPNFTTNEGQIQT